ncbi:[FeFe]-hydrogenase [Anopheles sinensis]|uniref:[FeFe]-hydrogenase n=1 Tax=Anopheles sinensis TaxID=74873 RepID=A0A084VHK1_ANOSI|nr:[FeFe]-hydrogenase [Anopheles sinensis]
MSIRPRTGWKNRVRGEKYAAYGVGKWEVMLIDRSMQWTVGVFMQRPRDLATLSDALLIVMSTLDATMVALMSNRNQTTGTRKETPTSMRGGARSVRPERPPHAVGQATNPQPQLATVGSHVPPVAPGVEREKRVKLANIPCQLTETQAHRPEMTKFEPESENMYQHAWKAVPASRKTRQRVLEFGEQVAGE